MYYIEKIHLVKQGRKTTIKLSARDVPYDIYGVIIEHNLEKVLEKLSKIKRKLIQDGKDEYEFNF